MKTLKFILLASTLLLMAWQAAAQPLGTTIGARGFETYDNTLPNSRDILIGLGADFTLRPFDTVLSESDPLTGVSTSVEIEDEYGIVRCNQLDSTCDTCEFETMAFVKTCTGIWDIIVTKRDMLPFTSGDISLGGNNRRYKDVWAVNSRAENFIMISDARLKQDIRSLDYGLNMVNRLSPVAYSYKSNPNVPAYGFLAQDVQQLMPDLVHDYEGELGLNYVGFIPLLTMAVQEMDAHYKEELAEKESRIASLEQRLNELENERQRAASKDRLANGSSNTLGQNIPNPFSDETTISYGLRADAVTAALSLHSATSGQLIREISLDPQAGKLTLSTRGLEPGAYVYTLIVDGMTIDSKIMIVQSQNR